MNLLNFWSLGVALCAVLAPLLNTAFGNERPFPQYRADIEITEVIDGDTVWVRLFLLPGIAIKDPDGTPSGLSAVEKIRLDQMNAPGIKSPEAKCEREIKLGLKAKQVLEVLISKKGSKGEVFLHRRRDGFGRLVGRIKLLDGTDLTQYMIEQGLAERSRTGEKTSWC